MLKKPGITLVISTLSLFIILESIRLADSNAMDNFWRFYNSSVIEPLEFLLLFTFPVALYLLFFNHTIQQAWWRWARWALVVPIALIILLLPTYEGGGGFISFGGTTDGVILWGVVFVAATLVTTLYHRFYLKTGLQ